MNIKNIGGQGLKVSQIGLGCMGMSEFYGHANDTESAEAIKKSYELGITFFDTSDMYGPYKNEILVGKALKDIRKKVVIATKFGIMRTDDPKGCGKWNEISGSNDEISKQMMSHSANKFNNQYYFIIK